MTIPIPAPFSAISKNRISIYNSPYLLELFRNNRNFEVVMFRDQNGYNPVIENYLNAHRKEIELFIANQSSEMKTLVDEGLVKKVDNVYHNDAPPATAVRLYALNKWASENGVDLIIHVHFNDTPRKNTKVPGKYTGFTVYVPERQYSNAKSSQALAEAVVRQLEEFYPKSDMPKESAGMVEDQELIATGSNNSLDPAAMLIEYGYIYEPQFQNSSVRKAMVREMALQTYIGVENFFGATIPMSLRYDTYLLPYDFVPGTERGAQGESTLALQMALLLDNDYPPGNRTLRDCPLSGSFKSCTASSLAKFQNKYGIVGESGIVGKETAKKLADLYSISIR
jgi:hypothetical protein